MYLHTDVIHGQDSSTGHTAIPIPDSTTVTQPSIQRQQDPTSNPAPHSSQYYTHPTTPLLTSDLASHIICKSHGLNDALTDLFHKLHQVQWAIDSLRNAISLAVDPVGSSDDTWEDGTEEAESKRAGLEQGKSEETGLAVGVEQKQPVD